MNDIKQLSDSDLFFYYDSVAPEVYTEYDIIRGCLQRQRSMLYNRSDSAGVQQQENKPQSYIRQILVRIAISEFVARRNLIVTDGSQGFKDRRALTSAELIKVVDTGQNKDVTVQYIDASNFDTPQRASSISFV